MRALFLAWLCCFLAAAPSAIWCLSRIRPPRPPHPPFFNKPTTIVKDPYIWDGVKNLNEHITSIESKRQPQIPVKESTRQDLRSFSQLFEASSANLNSAAICNSCKIIMGLMVLHVRQNELGDAVVEQKLKLICPLFERFTTREACEGLIERIVPTVAYIFRNRPRLTVEGFCGYTFQQFGCDTQDPYFEWDINSSMDIPKRVVSAAKDPDDYDEDLEPVPEEVHRETSGGGGRSVRTRRDRGAPVKILQLADMHVDPWYTPGAPAVCDNNILCCQNVSKKGDDQEDVPAGFYADAHKCDPPMSMLELTLKNMAEEHSDAQFFYMTGDIVPHNIYYSTKEMNSDIVRHASSIIYKYFPDITLISMLGNHEPHPVNCFSPVDAPEHINTRFIYDVVYDSWKQWIPADQNVTFFKEGFYVREISNRFKVVALNTNVCYGFNFWGMYNVKDPGGQIEWLVEELEKSEKKNQKVHIVGHVPPGHAECSKVWSRNFYNVIARYHKTVTAQFYGHTHYDEMKLFYSPTKLGEPINVLYISPSMTPYDTHNPSYKVFYADGGDSPDATWDIIDYETWVMDLTAANENPMEKLPWVPLYKATTAYGLPDTRVENLGVLMTEMAKNKTLFDTFYRHYFKALPGQTYPTNSTYTRKRVLCNIVKPYYRKEEECTRIQQQVDGIVLPIPHK